MFGTDSSNLGYGPWRRLSARDDERLQRCRQQRDFAVRQRRQVLVQPEVDAVGIQVHRDQLDALDGSSSRKMSGPQGGTGCIIAGEVNDVRHPGGR